MNEVEYLSSWLLPDKPAAWHADTEYISYLQDLTSYSVSQIRDEPSKLLHEKNQILADTQNLAFQNYSTFIEAADCSSAVFNDFERVDDHLDILLEQVSTARSASLQFASKSAELNELKQKNSLILTKHAQILEVLEIPQVMETCVRNGYYEEALELSQHVHRLKKRYEHVPIISRIAIDVAETMKFMQSQLLQQLTTNIQLPSCLKVVGYLRRMGVYNESEIRINFLKARDEWFQSTLDAISINDAYTYLSKFIENSRVHLFDIITQYRAIFPNDDPSIIKVAPIPTKSINPEDNDGDHDNAPLPSAFIFYEWVHLKISCFLNTLHIGLKCDVMSRMDSLLNQAMYFAHSFGRIGADFKAILIPFFHKAIMCSVTAHLAQSIKRFKQELSTYVLTTTHPSMALIRSQHLIIAGSDSAKSPQPPHSLLQFPPLARYLNEIITIFNEIRQCTILSIVMPIRDALNNQLEDFVSAICDFQMKEYVSFTGVETQLFIQFCTVTIHDLMRFINTIMLYMFPLETVNEYLARTSAALLDKNLDELSTTPKVARPSGKNARIFTPIEIDKLSEPLRKLYPIEIERGLREARRIRKTTEESSLHITTTASDAKLESLNTEMALTTNTTTPDTTTSINNVTATTNTTPQICNNNPTIVNSTLTQIASEVASDFIEPVDRFTSYLPTEEQVTDASQILETKLYSDVDTDLQSN